MKKINPDLIRKLKSYSALAAPLVAGAGVANGQVIYTDINPDTTLTKNGEIVLLDLNHDGINDFAIRVADTIVRSNTLFKVVSGTAFKSNSIAGSTNNPYIYPSALKAGDVIGSKLMWNQGSRQSMATFLQSTKKTSMVSSFGNWLNQQDKYLGLRFFKGQSYYYGWVRLDTKANKDTLFVTLKDYAYQAIGDSSIAAGDTGMSVSAVHNITDNDRVKINYYNHEVYVVAPTNTAGSMVIQVFDMEGRKMMEFSTSQRQYQFSTGELPEGLFLVSVEQNGKNFTKKISLR